MQGEMTLQTQAVEDLMPPGNAGRKEGATFTF